MLCQVCGDELTGIKREACSRSCRIKLDTIKRRESGRLRKANMTPEQYARKLAKNKQDSAKQRAAGNRRVTWSCVTCYKDFEVKRYSESGYWCSQNCRQRYWLAGITPSGSTALVKQSKARVTLQTKQGSRKWTAGNCKACGKTFVSKYSDKTCSAPCRQIVSPGKDWIDPPTRYNIYQRDNWTCHLCNKPVPQNLEWSNDYWQPEYPTLDHIVPRSHGGTDDPSNLKLAHMSCNTLRGNTPLGVDAIYV
jgi:hypothetical protein